MKFGIGEINNPTPASINLWVRIWTISAGIILTSMESMPFHTGSGMIESTIKWFLGLSIALANGLAPLFGAQITTSSISTERVTAVEENEK